MQKLSSIEGQENLPRYFAYIFKQLQGIEAGTFEIALPDGRVFVISGEMPEQVARFDIHDETCFTRLVREGSNDFLEAYMDGQWSTPDLQTAMDVVVRNMHLFQQDFLGSTFVQAFEKLRHWLNSNNRRQARKNISYHYDLGNNFYQKWLDDSMTYSSALFQSPQDSLEKAQENKYASMCKEMGVKKGDHILEIGCGWGGFAEYAAREYGARIKGLTISKEQYDYAIARIEKAGLSDQVEIVMQDYRDERGQYDGIASIEMFEAVGEKYWPTYFDQVSRCLKEGASATLQIITVPDERFAEYRRSVDFIQKYIFPGGMLPCETVLKREIARVGLEFKNLIDFRRSYSITLRRWYETFNNRWGEIAPLGFDERFKRMWNTYLTSCAAGFEYDTTGLIQITMQKTTR